MIRFHRKGKERHPVQNWLVRVGLLLLAVSGPYLLAGLAGLAPLETELITWNNIRMVAGLAILGCLFAAVGYGNE